jgi:hypothetical protein
MAVGVAHRALDPLELAAPGPVIPVIVVQRTDDACRSRARSSPAASVSSR